MGKASKYTEQEWLVFVKRVINGESLSKLLPETGYKLPFFSTKVKNTAKQFGYLDKYLLALKNQKIQRNNGVNRESIKLKYIADASSKISEWRPIKGYEENYEISDSGLVRDSKKELMSFSICKENTNFYIRYTLSKNGKKETFQAHRLVALNYAPNINADKLQIDHLDNNGLNNHISNLEWVTASENIQRSFTRNNTSKIEICSKGGKLGGLSQHNKAKQRLTDLMDNRFIKLESGFVTYLCERCNQQQVADITSKAFRYGWKGMCTPCKKIIRKEKSKC